MRKTKKFKKFIPILLSLMVIFIPFGNIQKAFAFSGGYLDGVPTTTGKTAATDNNDSTYIKLGGSHSGSPSSITYNLPRMETIQSYALNLSAQGCGADVKFLDSTGKVLYQKGIYSSSQTVTLTTPISGVTQVIVYFDTWLSDYYSFNLYEFNVFGPPHTDIANLALGTTGNNVNINYSIPTTSGYTGSKIYRDGTLIATQSDTANSYVDKSLSYGQSYTYKVTATYSDGFETTGATQSITIPKPSSGDVSNLQAAAQSGQVNLSWTNPTDSFFSSVNIYRDGKMIGSETGTTYKDTSVSSGGIYKYTVTTVSTYGVESSGVSVNAETPLGKLTNISDNPQWNKVGLSWTNPTGTTTFSGVNIYRDGTLIATTTGNTSSYTDSNVKSTTLYTYKLVPYSSSGLEGAEVEFTAYTPAEPPPQMVGTQFKEQPNGDVKITWQQPTTGTVNVFVGGKLYATVDASKLQELVLAADVVKTPFGDYAMQVQPVSSSGVVGEKVQSQQLGGQQLPFSASELVQSGTNLLWYVAPLILLALTFLLVPKLRKLLFDSIRKIRGKEVKEQTRRTDQEPKEERQQRERHEEKEHLEKTGLLQRIGLSKQETREEREQRERQERQQRNRELKEITELALKEPRESKIRAERAEKGERVQRITKTLREPRERIRQARERHREPRKSTRKPRQPRQPRGARGEY